MTDINKRIQSLRQELKKLEEAYYSGEGDLASDDLYDYKLRELINLEKQHPELITDDSPTKRVGFYNSNEINVKHEVPMLSLDNAFNEEDLDAYFTSCNKVDIDGQPPEYTLEPKIDGVSISLIYEKGYLSKAISRGDGEKGEDLTSKMLYIQALPIRIQGKYPERVVIRGEIYIRKSDFKQLNEEKTFANPRNYASGTLRLKDAEKTKNKHLRLCAYQILNPEDLGIKSQSEVLETLKSWGFDTHEQLRVLSERNEILKYIEEFGKQKNDLDIPCDGLVLKVNNLAILDDIGYTSKFPKWAIAYKYPSLIKESKLLEIIPTVGRTGKITYSAQIEPVEIEGSVVQFATLHNADYIQTLDLRIGDYVSVYKSGEIVPKIIGFNQSKRDPNAQKWVSLNHCPSCNSELQQKDNLSTQYCTNELCIEKKYARLSHWCSRDAADIEGMSIQIIKKLNKLGILETIPDIYRLHEHKEKIITSDIKIKEKSFNNLITSIEKSKDRDWRYLLFGLGISMIGEECASQISNKFSSIDELMNADIETIQTIGGIGEKGAQSISDWFHENKELMEELKSFHLFKVTEQPKKIDSFLTGKKIAITGKLSKARHEFEKLLSQQYGAIVQNDLNSKTDFLIFGTDAGSKLKKAQEKGIKIISEQELTDRLNELESAE